MSDDALDSHQRLPASVVLAKTCSVWARDLARERLVADESSQRSTMKLSRARKRVARCRNGHHEAACFLHERIDPVSLLSAIFAFSGLVFVVRPSFLFASESTVASWDAVGAALLGALGQVFVFITVRRLQGVHALVIVHYFILSSAVVALGWVLTVQKTFVVPSGFAEWRAIVGCGLFTFLGQMFLTRGFQLEKAGIASVMRYFDVVFVFIWDSALLKERINHWSIVGAAMIVSSAVVIAVRKMKQRV
ncbi:hypothetical protein PF002_g22743 [Phytophthora fragariae]|uniref:EamA domain-containing protein n=1 Tax=Phytophthora fragariae TaxID=53985 RepID=A0A6A3XGG7_9STRA|nr:hypothetical protein PF002_g22743 [Phytophthora fragariae]